MFRSIKKYTMCIRYVLFMASSLLCLFVCLFRVFICIPHARTPAFYTKPNQNAFENSFQRGESRVVAGKGVLAGSKKKKSEEHQQNRIIFSSFIHLYIHMCVRVYVCV